MTREPIAYINVEKRTLEFAAPIKWHTPTVANLDRIPLFTKEALADHIEDNLVMVAKGDAWRKQLTSAQRNELKQIEDGTWEADRNG